MATEFNFASDDVDDYWIEELFGPREPNDAPIQRYDLERWHSMAHIVHAAGLFPSVSQARKNGWDKPIPRGYSAHVVGKMRTKIYIIHHWITDGDTEEECPDDC